MKKIIDKYKKETILFLSFFILYFVIGTVFSYYLDTYKYWNVAFDMDTPRVFGDLALIDYYHYRASVHPLFIILFQPIILLINLILKNKILAIILLQSIVAGISVVGFNKILNKINVKEKLRIVLTLLFGLSLGQIIFSSNVETYIFAQVFLILLWLFVSNRLDKKLSYCDYAILILLGIGSIAVTITNFFQFIIAVFFLIFLNEKEKHKLLNSFVVIFLAVSISVLLADIQQIVWPSAPNFFTKNVNDFLYHTSEESSYMDFGLSLTKILNVINSNFGYSFNIASFSNLATERYLSFKSSMVTNIFSIISFIAFVVINIIFIIKSWKEKKKHKLYYSMACVYAFNFLLHLIYGNSIAFLYVCHYNFVILIILAYILKYFNKDEIKNKLVYYITLLLIVLLSFRSIVGLYLNLAPNYNVIEHFSFKPLIILGIASILLCLLIIKKRYLKIISILILIAILIIFYKRINYVAPSCTNCSVFETYEKSLDKYEKQLKDMKNSFSVQAYSEIDKPIGIFYFGMADRNKILYKDGKLIDIKTNEVIREFDYSEELIVPNEYTVILKDKENNVYRIQENEEGVYLYTNEEKELVTSGIKAINLPEFDKYEYSEILKVLHQEILFNIDGDIPKPNIFGYNNAWYRDTMLATMVLENTNNTSLLENWVKGINKIYDNSRRSDLNEVDNLGELLYIIGAVGVDRSDLVNSILEEIQNLQGDGNTIEGIVDGTNRIYYPTVLALYGAQKNNITLNLTVPEEDDGYAKLTWYDRKINTLTKEESKLYPYLNWAFYHYGNYGDVYMLNEIYPLSYEIGSEGESGKVENECFVSQFYCNKNLYLSHMWHASEMFLVLIEH